MALKQNQKVPLPDRGIVKYRSKNATYVYQITRIYRNEKGNPTNDRVSIGKIDEETGMLIPNRNYYELYESSGNRAEVESIRSFGVTFAVDGLLRQLGLIELMRRKFPKHSTHIIALAEYMLCEGNVMAYYEDWHDEVYPHGDVRLSSADISRVFQSIDYDSRMEFFKTWIYARDPAEYIAYDVTSVSSYSKGIETLAWGYNRDK